jgi:F-type H+-transporting ATPase subunit alpha
LLTEILKQERLDPGSPEFQLAWLIAFNDHKLDRLEPEAAQKVLAVLADRVYASTLDLDSSRDDWAAAIADWLSVPAAREGEK